MFVFENLGIDAKVICVNTEGKVFMIGYGMSELLYNSITEYIRNSIKR